MGITIKKKLQTGFVAGYARPLSSSSIRFDSGYMEVFVALYKDAEARFSGAEPAGQDRLNFQLTEEEREEILVVIYKAIDRGGYYAEGEIRHPDPEKEKAPEEQEEKPSYMPGDAP